MTAEIEAQFQASGTAGGLGIDATAAAAVNMGRIADVVERQWAIELRLYQAIFSRPLAPKTATVSAGAVTITSTEHDLGPPDGYAWAVQRLTAAGLASGDHFDAILGLPTTGLFPGVTGVTASNATGTQSASASFTLL